MSHEALASAITSRADNGGRPRWSDCARNQALKVLQRDHDCFTSKEDPVRMSTAGDFYKHRNLQVEFLCHMEHPRMSARTMTMTCRKLDCAFPDDGDPMEYPFLVPFGTVCDENNGSVCVRGECIGRNNRPR